MDSTTRAPKFSSFFEAGALEPQAARAFINEWRLTSAAYSGTVETLEAIHASN